MLSIGGSVEAPSPIRVTTKTGRAVEGAQRSLVRARTLRAAVTSSLGAHRRAAMDVPSCRRHPGPNGPVASKTATAVGKFWGNGSFNMTITATAQSRQRGRR